MNEQLLREKLKNTETFKSFEKFKQGIYLSKSKVSILLDYYWRSKSSLGITSLSQNPNILPNDVKIIEEILNN